MGLFCDLFFKPIYWLIGSRDTMDDKVIWQASVILLNSLWKKYNTQQKNGGGGGTVINALGTLLHFAHFYNVRCWGGFRGVLGHCSLPNEIAHFLIKTKGFRLSSWVTGVNYLLRNCAIFGCRLRCGEVRGAWDDPWLGKVVVFHHGSEKRYLPKEKM